LRRKAALLDTMTQYVRAVDGKNEAAVFELGKSVIRPAMAALGARTGKKIDYKIRGRRPFDVCQTAETITARPNPASVGLKLILQSQLDHPRVNARCNNVAERSG